MTIAALTSIRTNLSPFTKGCRDGGALMRIIKFLETGMSPTDFAQSFVDFAGVIPKVWGMMFPFAECFENISGDACNTLRTLWYKFFPASLLSTVLEQGHFCSASPVSLVTDLTNSQNHDDELRIWLAKRVAPPFNFALKKSARMQLMIDI